MGVRQGAGEAGTGSAKGCSTYLAVSSVAYAPDRQVEDQYASEGTDDHALVGAGVAHGLVDGGEHGVHAEGEAEGGEGFA